jgi:hypothetical protein
MAARRLPRAATFLSRDRRMHLCSAPAQAADGTREASDPIRTFDRASITDIAA